MTHKALVRRLQISCLGLDPIDPLRLLVDDVVAALAQPARPLTDDECDAIYTALDAWAREVDSYDFGLPAIAGGGMEAGRAIIRAAHGIKENT